MPSPSEVKFFTDTVPVLKKTATFLPGNVTKSSVSLTWFGLPFLPRRHNKLKNVGKRLIVFKSEKNVLETT